MEIEATPVNSNNHTRWWAAVMVILGVLGLSAGAARRLGAATFWSSCLLDIVCPAWNYVLLRGLYTSKKRAKFWQRFTPEFTGGLILSR